MTYAEYVRVRLVGSGLGSSLGSACSPLSSQTRLPSLRKGKDTVRGASGDRSGVAEGDVRLGSVMPSLIGGERGMMPPLLPPPPLLLLLLLLRFKLQSASVPLNTAVLGEASFSVGQGLSKLSRSALSLQVDQEDVL